MTAREYGEASGLGRKPVLRIRKTEFVANQIHEIGAVRPVMYGERRVETDLESIVAQQPRADPVERAGPGQRISDDRRIPPQHLGRDPFDPLRHLASSAAREGHQENAARIGTLHDQMRDPMRQRVRLARTGSGDDQEWPGDLARAMLDGQPLLRIEFGEIGGLEGRIMSSEVHRGMKHRF